MPAKDNRNISRDDKHYRKLLRTYKLIVYMVLAALFVLAVGLQLPDYIMDIRKIDLGTPPTAAEEKSKPYAAALDHARKEGLIDEDNLLLVSRAEFVRFCRNNKYFSPHGRESWKPIEGILKGPGGKTITAEQLAQTNQDIQLREGV